MRRYLALSVLAVAALATLPACNVPAPTIPSVEAGVTDAELALSAIDIAADSYFAANPNPKLQTDIDDAATDAEMLLRALNSALAGATSLQDSNVQAALQAFSDAFTKLGALVAQIGIQVSGAVPAGAARVGVKGARTVIITPPSILNNLKAHK